ncbi:MAG TPA: hypothetical protein VMD77_05645 [Candidatus Baltobacteraceae bacterium]|nr:hypothetical protein [Candidatus Baltobacteraceae bacterium]
MAVIVYTPNPQALLDEIRAAAREGRFETWSLDTDGDFTHSPEQWRLKAWLRPKISAGMLVFGILTPRGTAMTKGVYAVYHGRFIEMLLLHFDTKFQRALATALPAEHDQVRA